MVISTNPKPTIYRNLYKNTTETGQNVDQSVAGAMMAER